MTHSIVTRAGSSPRGGHTSTGPAFRLRDNGSLTLQQSSVADISGKIMQSSSGQATVVDSLMTRAVMGPEINDTGLEFRNSWIVSMEGSIPPQRQGRRQRRNLSPLAASDGQEIRCRVPSSPVFRTMASIRWDRRF